VQAGWRLDALTTYAMEPKPEPCTILALMTATLDNHPTEYVMIVS